MSGVAVDQSQPPEQPVYFYCSPIALRAGSVVEPGNWGRVIRSIYKVGDADYDYRLHREIAYEFGRRLFAPNAPSRLDCVFACPTIEEANGFREANNPSLVVHRVQALENWATHVTRWDRYGAQRGQSLDDIEEHIRGYWTDSAVENREVLIGGAVRIL